jgi:hypothetical protein
MREGIWQESGQLQADDSLISQLLILFLFLSVAILLGMRVCSPAYLSVVFPTGIPV